MNKLTRSSVVLGLVALMALITAGAATAEAIRKDFDVSPGGKLVVAAEGSKLSVRGTSSDEVRVKISRGTDDADDIRDDFDIDLSQDGNEVTVELRKRRQWGPRGWFSRSPTVEVDVPSRFNVDLKTSGGSVEVEDLEGDLRARTSGGSLRFADVDGPIYGRTSGGSIQLDGTSGNADLETSGGSIRIGEVEGSVDARTSGGNISIDHAGGSVVAKTSGGSIEVDEVLGAIEASTSGGSIRARIADQIQADSKLTTSGGSVTVYLQPSIAVDLEAHASGGRVSSELPGQFRGSVTKSRLEGELNGGGPKLYLRTSGGSVNVREL